MNLEFPDYEVVAQDEFVITARIRVTDQAALLAAARPEIRATGQRALLPDSSEFRVEKQHVAKSHTEISSALAEVILGHLDNRNLGIELIAGEISHVREFADRKDGALGLGSEAGSGSNYQRSNIRYRSVAEWH